MLDPELLKKVQDSIRERIEGDKAVLEELRADIKKIVGKSVRIQPRATTAISLVGTDGGNNKVEFDPFLLHLVRVVDSSKNEYCIEAVTPTTDRDKLSKSHFDGSGKGTTPLGQMMEYLKVSSLWDLSHMIQNPKLDPMPSWVQVYRELMEWAVLFSLLRNRDFGTDTVIVLDGLLRSKVFKDEHFKTYRKGLEEGIARQREKFHRNIYIVGFAKHSKVLQRYRLAMAMEGLLRNNYASYVEVPRELEEKTYAWSEYARGDDEEEGGEANKYVAGKMFFAKFGERAHDPIWPVDLFIPQVADAQKIFGYLLADAQQGFPVPFYPQCLQRAHENAALVGFDMDILQQETVNAIRTTLGARAEILDELRLESADPSNRRY